GAPLAEVDLAGEADVDRAVEAARAALEGDWRKAPPTERGRLLHALADAIAGHRDELAELEARNVGKAISSVQAEIAQAVETVRFFAGAVASIAGRANPVGGSLLFYSLKEPVGVCGQIVPWYYPLMLATWKLAPALAAGCTVVLKPDPQTPLTALRLAELAVEIGIPEGVVNVVPGDGPTVGARLVRHPGVDKISFTGSTATGAEVMRLAADPLKRLTLELGGKSPNIVFADANLDEAVASSAWAIFYSAGQSCGPREGRRPARPGDADGLAHLDRTPPEGARLRRVRGRRDHDRRHDRRRPRRVLPADGDRRRRQLEPGRAGGGVRPGRRRGSVRGRGRRRQARERRAVRADGDGVDRRSVARAAHRAAPEGGDGRGEHAVHRVSGHPVRRLQAIGLRPRARDRGARGLPRDQVGHHRHRHAPDESLPPLTP